MISIDYLLSMRCMGSIEQLDAALAALARGESALRLRLGQVLEVLGRGAVFELGFSSLGAYAVERCERSVRWAEVARCVARRLEALPELRREMAVGKVSWSMGELLARVATAGDEARWLELARSRTVRQVRELVAEAITVTPAAGASGTGAGAAGVAMHAPAAANDTTFEEEGSLGSFQIGAEGACTLTCTVDHEEAWLYEATRCLLEQLGVRGAVAQSDALLAEAQGTLLALLPEGAIDLGCSQGCDQAQQRWLEQLRRWRGEAEALCEKNVLGVLLSERSANSGPAGWLLGVAHEAALGGAPLEHASCTALDGMVRALATALASHELELSLLALRFHRADGWRRLGYASEAHYARERLGLSCSSLVAKRTLASRLGKLSRVAAALRAGHIGVEAALQLVRIATPKTEAAWVERARRRTIKHLGEEVAAALTAVRLAGERDCLPPEDAEMAAFQDLERAVVSGDFARASGAEESPAAPGGATSGPSQVSSTFVPAPAAVESQGARTSEATRGLSPLSEPVSEARRAWCVMLGSLASWLAGGLQTSAARPGRVPPCARSAGRVALRLRMSREAYAWWRGLEAQARRWLPPGMSWLRFLCLSMWRAWQPLLQTDVAYAHIYIRDRFRCTSPVCNRRDVTPHHLVFRSAGGSDAPHNVDTVCVWCHLRGVHGGRIRARGPAENIRWELGPRSAPTLIVHGRERKAA